MLGVAERRVISNFEQEEDAMKLNTAQVARTVSQLQVEALPEDHPLVPQLNRIFGDHTYFLDGSGLNIHILEPAAAALEVPASSIGEVGVLVNVANWTESNPPKLEVHEPELTNTTVALGTDGAGS
jgi:hypothetical protein